MPSLGVGMKVLARGHQGKRGSFPLPSAAFSIKKVIVVARTDSDFVCTTVLGSCL